MSSNSGWNDTGSIAVRPWRRLSLELQPLNKLDGRLVYTGTLKIMKCRRQILQAHT